MSVSMGDREQRAHAALVDVVDVEQLAPDIYRVTTVSDSYRVDPSLEACTCPDYEYRLDGEGRCKHIHAARIHAGETPVPTPGQLQPVATDGGGQWTVVDPDRGNERAFDSRAEAEAAADELADLGVDADIRPPDGDLSPETDGGQPSPTVVEDAADAPDAEAVDPQPDPAPGPDDETPPDRSVADDPLNWVPGEFVDEIDGTQAINRKGFEVLSHFYDIGVSTTLQVPPEETGHEYCRVKATATTPDGRECEAFGSAHVDRDDDAVLLLEMADTRARKRALSIATGVGAVAVPELKSEVSQ